MPHFANSPEVALGRNDSLDPARTCKGITAAGRACRRGLASRPTKSDLLSFYCWQHKDQAPRDQNVISSPPAAAVSPSSGTHGHHINSHTHNDNYANVSGVVDHRTSIDSMMQRLGLEDVSHGNNHTGGNHLPEGIATAGMGGKYRPSRPQTRPRPRRRIRRTYCCCFQVWETEEDDLPPAKVSHRPAAAGQSHQLQGQNGKESMNKPRPPPTQNYNEKQKRPAAKKPSTSWIPPTISPDTAALLRSELDRPLSDKDEPGYIYIFWLTPEEASTRSRGPSPAELFLSAMTNDNDNPNHVNNRERGFSSSSSLTSLSDAIRSTQDIKAFVSKPTSTNPGTIRLKIGRASNVQRRLNEWSRQCSYNLALIRYYPYIPSTSTSSYNVNAPMPRKVPYVHRVEHLIHTELGHRRIRDTGKCPECGKEHKEWFEIKAEKEELRKVDECIRRWVAWGERAHAKVKS